MSVYMSRLFPKSNSSFALRTGTALQAKIVSLREEMYLIDAGVAPPRVATQDEVIGAPKSKGPVRFTNRVGFLRPSHRETPLRNPALQRCFVDLVTGDSIMKLRAAAQFGNMLGPNEDAGSGEQSLLLPRRYRKKRAWVELAKLSRSNSKVKGFVAERRRGGYSVAIAGYLAFLSSRSLVNRRVLSDRYIIEKMNHKTNEMVVTRV